MSGSSVIRWGWAALASLGFLLVGPSARAQCQYEVTIIQAPECPIYGLPPTIGLGLNNLGHVVGYHRDCEFESNEAFVWTPESGLVTLDFPGDTIRKKAFDINDAGQIVGEVDFVGDGLDVLAFLRDGDDLLMLPPPAGSFSQPHAINGHGQVVGASTDGTPYYKAFLWEKGVMTLIELTLGPRSSARDINEAGETVGWMGSGVGTDSHAFLLTQGKMTDLGVIPGGFTASAQAINNARQIAMHGELKPGHPSGFIRVGFLWVDGEWTDLGMLPGYDLVTVMDLNDTAQVVGSVRSVNGGGGPDRAFIWQNRVMTDLNELVVSDDPNLHVSRAEAINSAGQIVGRARSSTGFVAVLLTPVEGAPADLDGDCRVGIADLLILLANWGPCPPKAACPTDINNDGETDILDLQPSSERTPNENLREFTWPVTGIARSVREKGGVPTEERGRRSKQNPCPRSAWIQKRRVRWLTQATHGHESRRNAMSCCRCQLLRHLGPLINRWERWPPVRGGFRATEPVAAHQSDPDAHTARQRQLIGRRLWQVGHPARNRRIRVGRRSGLSISPPRPGSANSRRA
jgi:probable HAF family extracellular repeat protein